MSREMGMPPATLARESPMSDRIQAVFSNPFYMVKDVASWLFSGMQCGWKHGRADSSSFLKSVLKRVKNQNKRIQ